ncbi:hypothetical protein [Azospirillum soli]|uniref:hypothetical protein n=1 Tax=Azospirillum soli TaxID=1304799 RepID=UPI001AE9C00F|nr:hypothetical protein [Azospirillum soli]MBP2314776.1 hypothetical protein [Azospirillum soli]
MTKKTVPAPHVATPAGVGNVPPPTKFGTPTAQLKPATPARPTVPAPPTRYGTPAVQPKAAPIARPGATPPPTRYGSPVAQPKAIRPQHVSPRPGVPGTPMDRSSVIQPMITDAQNDLFSLKKTLSEEVAKNSSLSNERKKELQIELGTIANKIAEGIDVTNDFITIRQEIRPWERPLPEGAKRINGKVCYYISTVEKKDLYGCLNENTFSGDDEKRQFYIDIMKKGLVESKSTGKPGVKKEGNYYVIKATISQSQASNGAIDNTESPKGSITSVGNDLLIEFFAATDRHAGNKKQASKMYKKNFKE